MPRRKGSPSFAPASAAPEVQLLVNIARPVDLLMLVVTRTMRELNAFADAYFAADPAVRRYETSFVKSEIKNRPTVPLGEQDTTR